MRGYTIEVSYLFDKNKVRGQIAVEYNDTKLPDAIFKDVNSNRDSQICTSRYNIDEKSELDDTIRKCICDAREYVEKLHKLGYYPSFDNITLED